MKYYRKKKQIIVKGIVMEEDPLDIGGFSFYYQFDSANLAKVEQIEPQNAKKTELKTCKNCAISNDEVPNYEFNIWTKHDCHGTEFQNNNKTWFYFGIKSEHPGALVRLNLVNLNKQLKMFSQGMTPVYRTVPGHTKWDRIKDKPSFTVEENTNEFTLSFCYRTSENTKAITYFAFTYPFSYTDLQIYLKKIDAKVSKFSTIHQDDIYYRRECAIKSLEGRRLDLLTISSLHNITSEKEERLKDLFPLKNEERPFKFRNKKVIFLSARVHPGETPSSFVLNGFLKLLLNREDQIAITLRRLYVFKLIPMLNPDGVSSGNYRMDTKGINLNRMYLNPSKTEHPTIFAAKTLLQYYHHSYVIYSSDSYEIKRFIACENKFINNKAATNSVAYNFNDAISKETNKLLEKVTNMSLEERTKCIEQGTRVRNCLIQASEKDINVDNSSKVLTLKKPIENIDNFQCKRVHSASTVDNPAKKLENSALCLYIDMHGHASKKGIFMYGNHFEDAEDSSACMLLPKIMSINNPNFHFTSCNFTERNMYLVDKRDGMSREGAGRVAVYKMTGLIHSYTLECNYNTGRLVNTVPAKMRDEVKKCQGQIFVPPKYTPAVYEEVGSDLGASILDMTGQNPNSRLSNCQYKSLNGVKSYLKLISTKHFDNTLGKPLNKIVGEFESRIVLVENEISSQSKLHGISDSGCLEPKDKIKEISNSPNEILHSVANSVNVLRKLKASGNKKRARQFFTKVNKFSKDDRSDDAIYDSKSPQSAPTKEKAANGQLKNHFNYSMSKIGTKLSKEKRKITTKHAITKRQPAVQVKKTILMKPMIAKKISNKLQSKKVKPVTVDEETVKFVKTSRHIESNKENLTNFKKKIAFPERGNSSANSKNKKKV